MIDYPAQGRLYNYQELFLLIKIHPSNFIQYSLSMQMSQLQDFYSPFDSKTPSQSQQWHPAFPEEQNHSQHQTKSEPFQDKQQEPQHIEQPEPKESPLKRWHPENNPQNSQNKQNPDLYGNISIDLSQLQINGLFDEIDVNIPEEYPHLQKVPQLDFDFEQQIEEAYMRVCSQGGSRVLSCRKDEEIEGYLDGQKLVGMQQRVIAARAFVYRGYGINYLKQQNRKNCYRGYQIDDNRFKSVSGSMAREAYRKLQSFLLRDCKQKIHSLAGYQMKLLQTLLLNCRSTLTPRNAQAFLLIVKVTYQLQDAKIAEQQAIDLYRNIYKALQKKIAGLRGHSPEQSDSPPSFQKPQIFSSKHSMYNSSAPIYSNTLTHDTERQIVREYIREQSLCKIRDTLGSLGCDVESKVVRNVLRRVLRGVIRRVEDVISQSPQNSRFLQRMNDQKIKSVLQASEGVQARKQLCRIYLMQKDDRQFFTKVYKQMMRVIFQREGRGLQGWRQKMIKI